MSDVLERPDTVTTDAGDHDRFSHYARKTDILRSQVEGVPCTALCGKEWNPTHDPEKYPVCPDCKNEWEKLTT